MKLNRYNNFITESKLQILLEEMVLTMSNDFSSILGSITNPIASFIISDKDEDIDKLRITNFDIHPTKNDQVLFDHGKQSVYIGRLASSYLKSTGIDPKTHYFIKEPILQDFVDKYKAAWDSLHSKFEVEVVSGDRIKWAFNINNYFSTEKGTLSNSCMRKPECQKYFDIYTENPVCKMLVQTEKVMVDDKEVTKVKGRAILWEAKILGSTVENSKKILFMDRIYTNNDSDVILFTKWARDNGYHYKQDQESSSDTPLMFDGNIAYEDYTMFVELEDNFYTNFWPYMDTLKYYYMYNDDHPTISNVENAPLLGNTEFEMEELDGSNSETCSTCDGRGFVPCNWCDGNSEMFCDDCGGSGTIEEEDGDEVTFVDCPECDGNGRTTCRHCDDGEQACTDCNRFRR
jgi:hypothetical protein